MDSPDKLKAMIKENVKKILTELPEEVELIAATKSRTPEEILEAIEAGVRMVGENYVQEAGDKFKVIGRCVQWHFIGHLQSNKVKRALEIFDMIDTVDSLELAYQIDKRAAEAGRIMPILIELNCAEEKQKFGVLPNQIESSIEQISKFCNIKIKGIMTMGPNLKEPEDLRPYFRRTCQIFNRMKSLNLSGVQMRYLSMGMSDSYGIAIEEGANLVRIGSAIFSRR